MIEKLIPAYLIGVFVVAYLGWGAISREPTSHGQAVLLPIGCVIVIFWPLALVWVLGVGIIVALAHVWRFLTGRSS